MFLGKVGVMALYAKKYRETKAKPKHQYLVDHQEKFKKQFAKKKIYRNSQWPKGAWFLGLMFNIAGICLFYILSMAENVEAAVWWRYLIVLGMIFLGCLFLISTDRLKIELHKEHRLLVMEKFNPFLCCRKLTIVKDLDKLEKINIIKEGHQAYQSSTIFYALEFEFQDGKQTLLEFNYISQVKLKYTEMVTFLEMDADLSNIEILDKSTHYKFKPRQDETDNLIG